MNIARLIINIALPVWFTLLLGILSIAQVQAEPQTTQLHGLDRSSVIRLLGQPTRSSSVPSGPNTNSSETLYYGDSQISFINNKVSSIFDLGEIKLALGKSKHDIDNDDSWINWPNPWTPPQNTIEDITNFHP